MTLVSTFNLFNILNEEIELLTIPNNISYFSFILKHRYRLHMTLNNSVLQSWTTLSDNEIFHRRYFAHGMYKDQYILVAGGIDRTLRSLGSAIMYDTRNRTIINLPDLPCEGYCYGVILKFYFYVYHYDGTLYRMDLSTRSKWEVNHSLIEMRSSIDEIVSDKDHLYFLHEQGGVTSYDPETNAVISLPSSPIPRFLFSSAVVGTRIYLIGGFYSEVIELKKYTGVDVFDVSNKSWSKGPPIPKALDVASVTVFRHWIVITGGTSDLDLNKETFVFDTINSRWSKSNVELCEKFNFYRCLLVRSQIVSFGGWNEKNEYSPLRAIPIKYLLPSWDDIKHVILLRHLIDNSRAHIIITKENFKTSCNENTNSNKDKVIQNLFTNISLDLFRNIISFLISR